MYNVSLCLGRLGCVPLSLDLLANWWGTSSPKSRGYKITAGKQGGDDAPAPDFEAPEHFDLIPKAVRAARALRPPRHQCRCRRLLARYRGRRDALRSVDLRASRSASSSSRCASTRRSATGRSAKPRGAGFELVAALERVGGPRLRQRLPPRRTSSPRGLGAASALLQSTPAATIFRTRRAAAPAVDLARDPHAAAQD